MGSIDPRVVDQLARIGALWTALEPVTPSESRQWPASPKALGAGGWQLLGESFRNWNQPSGGLAGVWGVMEGMGADTIEALFAAEYARLVRGLAVAYDAESASDAVQEAFIAADRRWKTVSSYDDPAAWIRRVALNRLQNGRRNRRRRSEILQAVRPVPADDLTAEFVDLRAAVAALPEKMRLAVCLHHLSGLPVADVADVLGVSRGTVKSSLHDARSKLRVALEDPHV